jgi:hypothetical protein
MHQQQKPLHQLCSWSGYEPGVYMLKDALCRTVTSAEQVVSACTVSGFRSTPSVLQADYQNQCPHTEVLTRAQAPESLIIE